MPEISKSFGPRPLRWWFSTVAVSVLLASCGSPQASSGAEQLPPSPALTETTSLSRDPSNASASEDELLQASESRGERILLAGAEGDAFKAEAWLSSGVYCFEIREIGGCRTDGEAMDEPFIAVLVHPQSHGAILLVDEGVVRIDASFVGTEAAAVVEIHDIGLKSGRRLATISFPQDATSATLTSHSAEKVPTFTSTISLNPAVRQVPIGTDSP